MKAARNQAEKTVCCTLPENKTNHKVLDFAGFIRFFFESPDLPQMAFGFIVMLTAVILQKRGFKAPVPLILQFLSLPLLGIPVFREAWEGIRDKTVNMGVLMVLAAFGAVVIGEGSEALIMLALFAVSESMEGYINDRARSILTEFSDLVPKHALKWQDGHEGYVPVEALSVGDVLIIRPGERFPMDGKVIEGNSEVNQAPITGESMLVAKQPGDEVFSSTVNGQGSLKVEVTRLAKDNTIQRIITLVTETQANRSKQEKFVDRFAAVYTPIVIVIGLLVVLIPTLIFKHPLLNTAAGYGWLHRGLSLLMIACPCALIISTPVTLISGLTVAAKSGVVFKGGVFLETLGNIKAIAFDKTGTLTLGQPKVSSIEPDPHVEHLPGAACPECDHLIAMASSLEAHSAHPLAQAIIKEAQDRGVADRFPAADQAHNLDGLGQEGWINGQLATVGSLKLFERDHADHLSQRTHQRSRAAEAQGQTVMLVCDGKNVRGYIGVEDSVRSEAKAVLDELRSQGIKTLMLTGDNSYAAEKISNGLGLNKVYAGLLPEEKLSMVEKLHQEFGSVAMVGDGINDSPALAKADLGIAMGGAGNAQVLETADVVLMNNNLAKLPFAVRVARFTNLLVRENIAISLILKALIAILAIAGLTPLWAAVFADVGLALLVTLNGLRVSRLKPAELTI